MNKVLELKNVSKSFGSRQVLKDVTLLVPEHTIYGFVGKNGAGKTTTMKLVLGLLKKDSGEITVCGEPVVAGKTHTNKYIGFLPDVPEFYDFMTPKEYLMFSGEICGMEEKDCKSRCSELLELVGLAGEKHRIKGFSRGMKQRLGIAQALLHRPKLLICDEPTSALDPVGRREILDIMVNAAKSDKTSIIFSTHVLSDVEQICDDVAFLNEGEICFSGSIDELKEKHSRTGFEIDLADAKDAEKFGSFGDAQVNVNRLIYSGSEADMRKTVAFMLERNIGFKRAEMLEPTLENVFMEVIGR